MSEGGGQFVGKVFCACCWRSFLYVEEGSLDVKLELHTVQLSVAPA
jgi:hypothetical protein